MVVASSEINKYFSNIEREVNRCYSIAKEARNKGLDPEKEVSIPLAKNMAERVVGLISVVCPKIINTKITERISELEKEYGMLDWRVGLKIAEEIAKENFCKFDEKLEAIEIGIRTGFAYLTLGVVSAPLEGFIGLKLKKRKDGKEYFALKYAGPIRGAGGTAASISVILADYVRVKLGYFPYDPEDVEINRLVTEVNDYHDRVTNLQYKPSEEELRFMLSHLPVEVDGDPTEKFEVSNYKDLPRIETNLIRGGVALVVAEGLTQKAPKLWKNLSKWGKECDLEWEWLEGFLEVKERVHAAHSSRKKKIKDEKEDKKEDKKTVKPNNTFIMDLVAGRPVLTHPLAEGGLRLRYGRTRLTGMYAVGMHPATLLMLNKYIAIGTQLKVERPRKGASVTVCSSLEGPIILLNDGSVMKLKSEEEAKNYVSEVDKVLFLGDIMFNYGDFSESGHSLVPVGYCPEWWVLEVKKVLEGKNKFSFVDNPLTEIPSFEETLAISKKYNVPLHPEYTFYWKFITKKNIEELLDWLKKGNIKKEQGDIRKIILPFITDKDKVGKAVLNLLGVVHKVVNKENIVIEKNEAKAILSCLDIKDKDDLEKIKLNFADEANGLEIINTLSEVKIRDKAGTFIGARMGRPEKAKMRHLTGSPQVMFPVGEEGDRLRSFQSALKAKKVRSSFPLFYCKDCNKQMIYFNCEECGKPCEKKYYCRFCGDLDKDTCRHGKALTYKTLDLDIEYFFNKAKERLGEKTHPDLIKGIKGTSNKEHLVEHLSKGILRAKYNIYVNKDGTTRYDATQLPITHFKPKEVGTSVEKLKELGYLKDISGKELTDKNQLLELKPQDIILPGFDSLEESAPKVFTRVAKFVDDLLVNFYKLKAFYNVNKQEDLTGHLVIGLAPHISAGMIGRIIGFSETQGLLAHPMYHASLRRDCDGDEAALMLLMDALVNFSRKYLPSTRGSTMDAPLVLTSLLNPAEVDDQVLEIDTVWSYPLELYEYSLELKKPYEVKIEQLNDRLGKETQYQDFGFTHPVDNLNKGVQCSAYKTIPSMTDKVLGQMEIARKVRAVDLDDVARLVIEKHFLKDIKGNLRKFSMQKFRCVKCNEKYHRPPLKGNCSVCGGKLIFTISEGSVVKYLGQSLMLAEKYDFSPYLKQTLEILKLNVDGVFGRQKDKQVGLGDFI